MVKEDEGLDRVAQILQGRVEKLVPDVDVERAWFGQVFDHYRNRCCGCGSEEHLKPKLIIPREAGGRLVMENSTLICRTCELAAELLKKKQPSYGERTRPVNFWIGRSLHKNLRNGLSHNYGFNSVASIVRFLMQQYVSTPNRFEDVMNYIDPASDVKVNIWAPAELYESFKETTGRNGLTVTDSLRALLRMYESEAERIFGRKER